MDSDSDSSPLSEGPPVKADGAWFEDGNVVLQTEGKLFKVYRGILIRESDVFEGMFSLPQPSKQHSDEDTYEGCQLVKMHDDDDDLEHFLRALFDFDYWNTVESCSIFASILRMATKYQASIVRKRVLRILGSVYPDTLRVWDTVVKAGKSFPEAHPLHKVRLDDEEDHVAVINAARDADALILLPAAMLRIYQTGIANIVKGEASALLDAMNKEAILGALPDLARLSRERSFPILYTGRPTFSPDCSEDPTCFLNRKKLLLRLERPQLAYIIDPFNRPSFIWTSGARTYDFCFQCRTLLRTTIETGRSSAWEELPQAFGLSSWEELRKAADQDSDEEMADDDQDS